MSQKEIKTGDADALDGILVRFYDSVLEPDALLDALTAFDRWIGSSVAHLVAWDSATQTAPLSLMTRPEYLMAGDAYAQYYGAIDPRRALMMRRPVGDVFSCADHFDDRFVGRDEFYQDLLIPHGIRYIAGGCLFREDTLDIYVAFNHSIGQPAFSATQKRAIRRLMPHLKQTLRLMMRTESLRAGLFAGDRALDAMEQGVVVIDRRNEVVFCNRSAQAWLGTQRTARASGRRIETAGFWKDALLAAMERVRVHRRPESLTVRDARQTWHLTVLALPSAERGAPAFRAADLMLTVTCAQRTAAATERQLAQMFGLTPAEARLAHGLATGLSLDEHAAAGGITTTTARNQLRAVLAKTGQRRQQDLVRMLVSLPSFADQSPVDVTTLGEPGPRSPKPRIAEAQ
ncbi:helix-turn-helix transcriptional regulator [Burkholderia guangdongensis]|uniref:helix-turn-helix transcriptional regulator n=1 Tax=Burkholderia guangdongensis TaxID=1792500 RepID=UPI0015C6CA5B|nr:helix-turn-helix transcriptional regulator [Burkholderia guangdongensis]